MVLVLTNEEMERLEDLPMDAIIAAMEGAYRELGEGSAQSPPRRRLVLQPPGMASTYWFNNIMGAVPSVRTMALRVDSSFFRMAEIAKFAAQSARGGLRRARSAVRHGYR